jgi:acyl-CoA thioesterase II
MTQSNTNFVQIDQILDYLQTEQIDKYLFSGQTLRQQRPRVFGGQVLAQALNSAARTVDSSRRLHSLHSYFLRPGDSQKTIIYDVDPIRDGKNFTTRRVVAKQNGKAIFNASFSFQRVEEGLEHQIDMPTGIPSPESLPNEETIWLSEQDDFPKRVRGDLGQFQAFDTRVVARRNMTELGVDEPAHGMWFKSTAALPNDIAIHQMLLAYISDLMLLCTAFRPHPVSLGSQNFQAASLDHAMWFHSDFRVDDWLYYDMESPRASGARGFNRGSFYTQKGVLVSSTAQEGLMRKIK